MSISKDDLARQYAKTNSVTIKEARRIVSEVTELITANLEEGKDVLIKDFFYFKVKERPEKKAVSLVNGEPTVIPATKTVVAKMTKHVKHRVQGRHK